MLKWTYGHKYVIYLGDVIHLSEWNLTERCTAFHVLYEGWIMTERLATRIQRLTPAMYNQIAFSLNV